MLLHAVLAGRDSQLRRCSINIHLWPWCKQKCTQAYVDVHLSNLEAVFHTHAGVLTLIYCEFQCLEPTTPASERAGKMNTSYFKHITSQSPLCVLTALELICEPSVFQTTLGSTLTVWQISQKLIKWLNLWTERRNPSFDKNHEIIYITLTEIKNTIQRSI